MFYLFFRWREVDSWGKIQRVQTRLQTKLCHSVIMSSYISFLIANFRARSELEDPGALSINEKVRRMRVGGSKDHL